MLHVCKTAVRNISLWLFSHRYLAVSRWEMHFILIRLMNWASFKSNRIRKLFRHKNPPKFLNLGAGPRGLSDRKWLNVDGFNDKNIHFMMDITRPLAIPSYSLEGVFCEHVLEHFTLDDGVKILRELHRILKAGGVVRIIVPDAELIISRYLSTPDEIVLHRGSLGETPMEVVNSYFRQRYEHQFLYDWPTMRKALEMSGFQKIQRASFGSTTFTPELVLDHEKYKWESLYVEAYKEG